ncbi:MAG: hypothetical protein C0483_11250 [Pirellula sp.]|nr:hypothetical protein [Pirellula sp.]
MFAWKMRFANFVTFVRIQQVLESRAFMRWLSKSPLTKVAPKALCLSVWLCAVAIGFSVLLKYKSTSAEVLPPASDWPDQCAFQHAVIGKTLVMFVHPRCPCTRASIRELEFAQARSHCPLRIYLVILAPEQAAEWSDSDVIRSAAQLRDAVQILDTNGEIAAKFNARTSGYVLLYNEGGRLLFSGGITGSRGHEGDNDGLKAMLEHTADKSGVSPTAPVFGCSLDHSASLFNRMVHVCQA